MEWNGMERNRMEWNKMERYIKLITYIHACMHTGGYIYVHASYVHPKCSSQIITMHGCELIVNIHWNSQC